jgi:hypothetical protein
MIRFGQQIDVEMTRLFRTAKYRPEFPFEGFGDLESARQWAARTSKGRRPEAGSELWEELPRYRMLCAFPKYVTPL